MTATNSARLDNRPPPARRARPTSPQEIERLVTDRAQEFMRDLGGDIVLRRGAIYDVMGEAQRHHALNELAREYRSVMPFVAGAYKDFITRHLGHEVSPSEFRVITAIWDRTLGWANTRTGVKISDTITATEWVYGLLTDEGHATLAAARNETGNHFPPVKAVPWRHDDHVRDNRELRIFTGVGMSLGAINTALKSLGVKGLITRLRLGSPGSEKWAYHLATDWVGLLMAVGWINSGWMRIEPTDMQLLAAHVILEVHRVFPRRGLFSACNLEAWAVKRARVELGLPSLD